MHCSKPFLLRTSCCGIDMEEILCSDSSKLMGSPTLVERVVGQVDDFSPLFSLLSQLLGDAEAPP